MPKIQFTFQCIAPTKSNVWKGSLLISQTYSEQQNPENCSSIGQILLKIYFLKQKITSFEKTSFELAVTEILKIKLQYLKI